MSHGAHYQGRLHMAPFVARALLGCVLLLCASDLLAAHGRTAGSFSVSNSGAAQYSIPIWTPPGVNGLQPNLTLHYSSTKSDGLLGAGFSIPGLSTIGHCKATIAQDGYAGGLGFGTFSILCLDGNRLRLQSGVAGQAGSVYRTEIESYSRITAYGTAGSAAAYFIVEAKNGLYYEYGNTGDSRIEVRGGTDVRNWALNRVRDRAGNYMDYVYTEDAATGSYRIDEILYAGNIGQGTSPTYKVKFVYETANRPDPLYAYYPGANGTNEINEFKRLDKIEVYRGANLLRFYDISWDATGGAGGQSRISSVQECASASDCFLPTSFAWRSGTAGFGAQNTVSGLPSAWPMDINGDGRDDLVYSTSNVWRYRLGNVAGGFDAEVSSGISSVGHLANETIEWDGDGRDDLLLISGGTWRILRSNGSGFDSPINTGITADGLNTGFYDINADGRHDLLRTQNVSGQLRIYARLRLASGFASSETLVYEANNPWISTTAAGVPWVHPTWRTRTNVKRWDYDGDRREDFALFLCYDDPEPSVPDYCAWVAFYGAGTPTTPAVQMGEQITADGLTWAPMPADLNGDGTTDLIYAYGGAWRSRASAGWLQPEIQGALTAGHTGFPVITDYDSDGKTDLVIRSTSSGTWEIVRGNGIALSPSTITGPSAANGIFPFIGDFNGDGLSDLAWTNSATNTLTYMPRAGVFPDLLQTVTDGFGVGVTFNYASLAAYSGYTRTSGAVYPTQEFAGTMQVVSSVQTSDGIGGAYFLNNFQYEGARVDLYGRGPLGFSARSWTDSRNGLIQKLQFEQSFPLVGMTKKTETWNGSALVVRNVSTNASATLDSSPNNQRHFVYASSATATQYEVGGAWNGALLRTVTR